MVSFRSHFKAAYFQFCRVLGGRMRLNLARALYSPARPRSTLCYCAGASYRKSCISRIVGSGSGSGSDSGFGLFLHIFFCCRCSAFVGRGMWRIEGKVLRSGLPHKTLQWRPVKGPRRRSRSLWRVCEFFARPLALSYAHMHKYN